MGAKFQGLKLYKYLSILHQFFCVETMVVSILVEFESRIEKFGENGQISLILNGFWMISPSMES